jgi:hypothetical protein
MSSTGDHVVVSYAEFVERRARLHRGAGTMPDGDPSGVGAIEAPAADLKVCTTGAEPTAVTTAVPSSTENERRDQRSRDVAARTCSRVTSCASMSWRERLA